jgi:osmoprotectant transport system permease protein
VTRAPHAMRWLIVLASVLATSLAVPAALASSAREASVTIGSKAFPESWVLGEALAALARGAGADVDHKRNLGGTEIVFAALASGGIDAYVEYTGTLREVILHAPRDASLAAMREELARQGLGVSDPLGFDDTYALAVTEATRTRYHVKTISDLARVPQARAGFTHEFLGRRDGYPGLAAHYGLTLADVRGIQHELAFDAIARGDLDVIDIYTTDAQIERLGLRLLEDDRAFFPRYEAVILYRTDLATRAPRALGALMSLVGKIDAAKMMHANARLVLHHASVEEAAATLLGDALGGSAPSAEVSRRSVVKDIAKNTLRHLELVLLSLFAAIVVGLPLGIAATRSRVIAAIALSSASVVQTIPSLALLAFLIPIFGIGATPAVVALFLYGLLPIVRSTYTGLTSIPTPLAEAADAIGLSPRAKLLTVMLPLASPHVMAGIKTSAVISVGTATLAALIGAEGLGNPILQGIALRDTALILEGAVPAAILAMVVQVAFASLDHVVVPRGLRLSQSSA